MAGDCVTLTLEKPALRKLDSKQLFGLMDVLCILDGMMTGFTSQARFLLDAKRLNPAGEVLSELSDWLVYAKRAVSDEVESRAAPTKDDAEWLGWARIQFEASYRDDMAAFNVIVAQAISAKENAND